LIIQSTIFHGILHAVALGHDAIAPLARITNPNSRRADPRGILRFFAIPIADITGNGAVAIQKTAALPDETFI
jgi:hypothetical protein